MGADAYNLRGTREVELTGMGAFVFRRKERSQSGFGYEKPSLRSFAVAVIASLAILLLVFRYVPTLTKGTGAVLSFVPDQLGITEQVGAEEVIVIPLEGSRTTLELEGGTYAVYTADETLLRASLGAPSAWLNIRSVDTGEAVEVSRIDRGLRPYDTLAAAGRPIIRFEIEESGRYEFAHPARGATSAITVVPDYTVGQERTIWLSYLVQIAVIVLPVAIIYYTRRQARIAAKRVEQEQKRLLLKQMVHQEWEEE